MPQHEIDQAVARTLGEDIREIRKFGFSMLDLKVEFVDPECDCQDPQAIDWDGCDGASVESFHEIAA